MRTFQLYRTVDVSGTSGTGTVAKGVEFPDGQCTLWWPNFGSIGIYKTIDDVKEIHGHEGRTLVVFEEEE